MMVDGVISKLEFKLLVLLAALGLVMVTVVNPYFQSQQWFQQLNPLEAYLLYNLGMYFIITAILGIPSGILITRKWHTDLPHILTGGLASFLVFSNILDMWQPPLAWDPSGNLLMSMGANLGNTAVDYLYGWAWLQAGGPRSLLYLFVYGAVPILTFIFVIYIYDQKDVVKIMKGLVS